MIYGFLGPVGTLICGFQYTKLLQNSKTKQEAISENIIWENAGLVFLFVSDMCVAQILIF